MKLLTKLRIPLAIIGIGLIVSLISRVLRIKTIECSSQSGACSEEVIRKIETVKGVPYITAKKRLADILTDEITVAKFNIHFQLPAKLSADIVEFRPKYAVKNSSTGETLLIGDDGRVLSRTQNSNLPTVITEKDLSVISEQVDDLTLFACELVLRLGNIYKYESATIEGDKLIVVLTSGPTVIFPLEGDKEVLLGALVLVMDELNTVENGSKIKNPTTLDLRFKNPVLKY